jgi:hypothetical protein
MGRAEKPSGQFSLHRNRLLNINKPVFGGEK